MFHRLGLPVFYVVYPHRWEEIAKIMGEYSERLEEMARALPVTRHLACKVEIDDRLVLVDATLDLSLQKAGFTVNAGWDGRSEMPPAGDALRRGRMVFPGGGPSDEDKPRPAV